MKSVKKKQDEKNLKILRELVSLPGNKECFDCRQRGPTYVNMTIGSFVCTSCSGMLRGLNPPHRVKSISMATFTQDEIDQIKERGNDYCRKIWLGLTNPNWPENLYPKDEQKMKSMMTAKYELKRYYLDPSMINNNQVQQSPPKEQQPTAQQSATTTANNTIPSINPVSRASNPRIPLPATSIPTIVLPVPAGKVKREQPQQQRQQQFDTSFNNENSFVADFSKVPDPIYAVIPNTISNQPPVQANFANFDRENILNLSNNSDTMKLNNGTNAPPSEDRYAALKDLDSLMKKASLQNDSSDQNASHWSITNSNDSNNSIWNTELFNSNVISNPFKSDAWNANSSATILNNNVQSVDTALYNTANPFTMAKQSQFPLNGDQQWTGSAGNDDVIASSQLMMSLSNRSWQPTISGQYVNPFMVGPATRNVRNSNNPFL